MRQNRTKVLFAASGLLMIVVSAILDAAIRHGGIRWGALGIGWALACVNALLALVIWRQAVQGGTGQFVVWGMMMNGLRFLAFLGCILLVYHFMRSSFSSIAVAVFAGYFSLLIGEVFFLLDTKAAIGKSE